MDDLTTALTDAYQRRDWATVDQLERTLLTQDVEREARLTTPGATAGAATWYATHGIPVFPCRPHTETINGRDYGPKSPRTAHGFKDATTDHATIVTWWERWPDSIIGTPTGALFDVIDIDSPTGLIAFHTLIDRGELDPPNIVAVAHTPRGRHYYIPPTGDGNTTKFIPDVDYRGAGGYVILPPSQLTDGGTYRWQPSRPLNLDMLTAVTTIAEELDGQVIGQ